MKVNRLKEKTLNVTGILDEFEKDEVKKRVDIVSLFNNLNIKLTKKGKNYVGLCPWHDDSTPSLSVDKEKGLYNCFGCGESGDVFTLVEKMKGFSFREALAYLKNDQQFPLHSIMPPPDVTALTSVAPSPGMQRPGEDSVVAPRDVRPIKQLRPFDRSQSLTSVVTWYASKLHESKPAREYLKKRCLDDTALLNRFKIGFVDGSLSSIIGETQKDELTEIGILNQYGKEHFANCIIFPIFDEAGQPVGIYGRSIDNTRETKHLYLKGSHKGVFNRKASKVYNEIILTESIIDALSLVKLGFANVQSIYGTNGFTDEHLQILKDDRVKTVILALDNDEAGKKASEKLKAKLIEEGFAVKVIIPSTKDWNEYLVNNLSADEVKELINSTELITPIESNNLEKSDRSDFLKLTKDGIYYNAVSGNVNYRISGVKEIFVGNLRVAIKAVTIDEGLEKSFVDTLELYSSKARNSFALNFSKAGNIEAKRIENDLLKILDELEAQRDRLMFGNDMLEEKAELTEQEKQLALSLLQDPNLFDRIVADMDVLGYVGEDVNKKLLYLAASSRILDDPISVIILSQSASGKSFLVDTVRKLMPPSETIAVTSLSDQALNYVDDLMHKFLILGEAVHSDSVEHQIREMLSGKELSRLVTVKDEKTGVMKSEIKKKPVIVSAVMSGTNYGINPENASRCFVISADESREQTRRIHKSQREKYTLERYAVKENEIPEIIKAHHAAQRMLRKVKVVNPFAHMLDFPDSLMRTRRDNDRFMDLIACVAFLRQFQKETSIENNIEYIECDETDYEIAYKIMIDGVLSATMSELPSGTVQLYDELRRIAKKLAKEKGVGTTELIFIQKEIREKTSLGGEFIKKHLRILSEFEYVQIVSGKTRGTRISYRLRSDEEIERVDLSMIPRPEAIKKHFK